MSMFMQTLTRRMRAVQSVLCVGLDPTPEHVPPKFGLGTNLAAIARYLMAVIDLAAEKAAIVKPQYAYYAAMGPDGIRMMTNIIAYAKSKGLLVILDAKRADIGDTMEMYAIEVFDQYGVDACTFVPYLGPTFLPAKHLAPSWLPWLKMGKGVIPMIRTSNDDSLVIQKTRLEDGRYLYQAIAEFVKNWSDQVVELTGGRGMVGGVVGATHPEEAVDIRQRTGPDLPFLIPGYGAQGGGASGAVAGFSKGGLVGMVNSSRGITRTSWQDKDGEPKPGDPIEHVAAAIEAANTELNLALEAKFGYYPYVSVLTI